MKNVLITSECFGMYSPAGRKVLTDAGLNVIDNPYGHTFLSPEQIIPHIKEADAIICDLEKITKEVIGAAPNLKIIARRGVGVDSVDCAYAAEKGIEVARTNGVVEAPVAEIIFADMFYFMRRIDLMNEAMQAGSWAKGRILGNNLIGKTMGIVGLGKIGSQVFKRAAAFGMNVIYHDIESKPDMDKLGAKQVDFDTVMKESDFVSVNVPLDDSTRGMFCYDMIKLMKPTAYLINAARGAIVDVDDLKKALEEKLLAGAAIDVFDVEPEENSPLRGLDNVVLTPHVATFTKEAFIDMSVMAAQNVVRCLNGTQE